MTQRLTQTAPWPAELDGLVRRCRYKRHEGWRVFLADDAERDRDPAGAVIGRGATLVISTRGYDAYHPERGPTYGVHHYFIVPAATYNEAAWRRWLFDQFAKVELHECMEHFTLEIGDGAVERPFAPLHGPGCDPYTVHQYATGEQARTRFTGEILPE